jgi:hypothetical protein
MPGAIPVSRLNALLNAASDSYPTNLAILAVLTLPWRIMSPALCIRHRVTYISGGTPTNMVRREENAERDMPICEASSATVHD